MERCLTPILDVATFQSDNESFIQIQSVSQPVSKSVGQLANQAVINSVNLLVSQLVSKLASYSVRQSHSQLVS